VLPLPSNRSMRTRASNSAVGADGNGIYLVSPVPAELPRSLHRREVQFPGPVGVGDLESELFIDGDHVLVGSRVAGEDAVHVRRLTG
jgi:hypothetical protein